MGFSVKVNIRETTDATGAIVKNPPPRTLDKFNNFELHLKYNSLASTFSFDFYFDPTDAGVAEIICVSHLHECSIYYNGVLEFTGYMLANKFKNNGNVCWATVSGYSKPGVLNECDVPQLSDQDDGLTFRQIITRLIQPFHLGLQIDPQATGVNKIKQPKATADDPDDPLVPGITLPPKSPEELADEAIDRTDKEVSQNIGSYISELAQSRNIVLSHLPDGRIWITTPNTAGTAILNFDFTSRDPNNDAKRIPGLETEMDFNAQGMHTHITAKQQADDKEGSNGSESTVRNPLLPVGPGLLYRPHTIMTDSGTEFTVHQAAAYEMGKEIRDSVPLVIKMGRADIGGKLIRPNNTLTFIDPFLFLYKSSSWFIQDVVIRANQEQETSQLNCVLPYGYDYIENKLKNVFVNAHDNLPKI